MADGLSVLDTFLVNSLLLRANVLAVFTETATHGRRP